MGSVKSLNLLMHMLAGVHTLFYGGFLQPFQAVLRWKRIQMDPVHDGRFGQSLKLAKLVYEELQRMSLQQFHQGSESADTGHGYLINYYAMQTTYVLDMFWLLRHMRHEINAETSEGVDCSAGDLYCSNAAGCHEMPIFISLLNIDSPCNQQLAFAKTGRSRQTN